MCHAPQPNVHAALTHACRVWAVCEPAKRLDAAALANASRACPQASAEAKSGKEQTLLLKQ
jgi:hypothetical protein